MHGEDHAFDIDVKHAIEVVFLDIADRGGFGHTGICEHHVHAAVIFFDRCVKPVDRGKVPHITLHTFGPVSDISESLI